MIEHIKEWELTFKKNLRFTSIATAAVRLSDLLTKPFYNILWRFKIKNSSLIISMTTLREQTQERELTFNKNSRFTSIATTAVRLSISLAKPLYNILCLFTIYQMSFKVMVDCNKASILYNIFHWLTDST